MPDRRQPGQRAGLTRDAVLSAARDLVGELGFDRLSMRVLASRLGVSPNAVYSYVESKTALVDHLLDETLAVVQAPAPEAEDTIAALHALMVSTYEVLLAHADLVPAYLGRQGARGPNAVHLGEIMLTLLARAGLTSPDAREARHVLIVYTIGAAAFATRSPLPVTLAAPQSSEDHRGEFEQGLRWLLIGIHSGASS